MTEKSDQTMSAQDWFGVGVRLVALYPLFLAVQQALYFIDIRFGLASKQWSNCSGESDPIGYLVYALGYFLLSLFMLRATPVMVRFAYPSRPMESDEESESEPTGSDGSQS